MLRALPLFVALSLAGPALAQDIVGPGDIAVDGAIGRCRGTGPEPGLWSCLAEAGVPAGGIAFARRLEADPVIGSPGLMIGFTETGAVDLADVLFPFLANTNEQTLFVNGTAGVVQPLALQPQTAGDAQSQAILAAHPQAFPSLRLAVVGHRAVGARQRFIASDVVTDGCRACAVVAVALTAYEFEGGALSGVTALGWIPPALADDEARAAALAGDDMQALQVALTLRGYAPGPMDGQPGEATTRAVQDFLTDVCLRMEAGLSEAALAILAAPPPYLDPPPCQHRERDARNE
ncbi:peptidoglycan-binding domain-containing protein [Pararhodobacter aggregans]|uniref:Peptidoglycan binding-like domain-containing protein n=1 Tax=Pararhodobacter aggregans TaxID=404875 RepID=A0A2T7UY29_9RHOB|nr:peptidoglycan-binding domain-containing protein [Pararhodobacter aggregans]PTX05280.1 hypothetical protein C8N33_101697 [Pararhodobacter aggregans]PVE49572.1 hypothetical protein DDE23_04015 [Pararhodobacter aggregans]